MQTPSDQQGQWAQQDSNLRPLGDQRVHHGVCRGITDLHQPTQVDAVASPNITGNSDGKVTADLGRVNILNWRVTTLGVASWFVAIALITGAAALVSAVWS